MKSVSQGINAAQFNIQPLVKGAPRPHLRSIVCCSQRLGLDRGVKLGREFRGSLGPWGGRSPIRSVLQVSECLMMHSVRPWALYSPILHACFMFKKCGCVCIDIL